MPEQPGAGQLDPETLAAYIDGQLPPEERASVEAVIAADPETYEWVVNIINGVEDGAIAAPVGVRRADDMSSTVASLAAPARGSSTAPVVTRSRRTAVRVAGTLLAAAAALLIVARTEPVWWQALWAPAVDPRVAGLVATVGEERYFEARLSGGFKYGPMREVLRGPQDLSRQNLRLLAEAGEAQRAAQADPTPDNLYVWGVAQLLLGEYDESIASLEDVAADRPRSYEVLSDLAAAYSARASALSRADDWPKALDSAERAVIVNADRPEAYYTRALALTELHLTTAAIAAWQDYLDRDDRSGWAEDARRRLNALRAQPPISRTRDLEPLAGPLGEGALEELLVSSGQQVRRYLSETLLAEWADAVLDSDGPRANGVVRQGVTLTEWYAAKVGDRLPVEAIRALPAGDIGSSSRSLAVAIRQYVRAVASFERNQPDAARADILAASRHLDTVGHPLALSAAVFATELDSYDGHLLEEGVRLDASIEEATRRSFVGITARAHNRRALSKFREGDLEGALRHRLASLRDYTQLNDTERMTALHATVSENYRNVHDYTSAWRHGLASLGYSVRSRRLGSRHLALLQPALTASAQALRFASLRFVDALIEQGETAKNPSDAVIGYVNRALTRVVLDRDNDAMDDVMRADAWLARIEDPTFRARNRLEVAYARAFVAASVPAPGAVAQLGRTIDLFAQEAYELRLPSLLKLRARAHDALGSPAAARQDLDRAAAVLERQRGHLLARDFRMLQSDDLREIRLTEADIAYRAGDVEGAARLADVARARTIAEELSERLGTVAAGESHTLAPVDGTTLLVLTASERPFGIVIGPAGVDAFTSSCPLEKIAAQVRAIRRLVRLEAADPLLVRVLGDVYSCLIAPAERLIATPVLTIVPDGIFGELPFGALHDGRTFLCEKFEVRLAPSGAWMRGGRGVSPGPLTVSIFADPAFDRPRHPGFLALPQARQEAREIARQYPSSELLVGDAATRDAFLARLLRPGVVHFAGHALSDGASPLSMLLLTAAAPDNAGVSGYDVMEVGDVRTDLVVLAACTTANSPRGGEGIAATARPFLAVGVPAVVASLWMVGDQATRELMVEFHRRLTSGLPPARSLRESQRLMISRGQPIRRWAAFVAFDRTDY